MTTGDQRSAESERRLLMEMAGYARALRAAGADPARLMEAYGDRLVALADETTPASEVRDV